MRQFFTVLYLALAGWSIGTALWAEVSRMERSILLAMAGMFIGFAIVTHTEDRTED